MRRPFLVVAPTRVNGFRAILTERAPGPLSMRMSIANCYIAE